ncbi:MAG: transglycosylase domain-containing protein [Chloroflexota bacterium]
MIWRFAKWASIISITAVCISILFVYVWALRDLPPIESLSDNLNTPSIQYTDRHGNLLYESIDGGAGRHQPIPLDEISPFVLDAIIATEDINYYSHPGVDLVGITRALYYNLRGQDILVGGSTITQQLVKNLLLSEEERVERSFRRKIREAWLAWRLEQRYSKEEILALYLNQIYFGGFAYGIEGASQTFFGISATDLTLAQAALLAGLPQAPGTYNPFVNPSAAKGRQEVVLSLMLKNDLIPRSTHDLALREPLSYQSTPYPIYAPHFVQMLQVEVDQLLRNAAEDRIYRESIIVRSTLDLNFQEIGETILHEQLKRLNEPQMGGYSHNATNGAIVAIDPGSGDVLTLVGSNGFFDAKIAGSINMGLSPRQPGSTLKPLFYAAGMDPQLQDPFTPATLFYDVETTFLTKEGEPYIPVNFSRTENGPVLLREALASSLNIPAVQALDQIGIDVGLEMLDRLGIKTFRDRNDYDLSLALGGGEVTLFDLTAAYGVLANGGERVPPRIILDIKSVSGETLYAAGEENGLQVVDERVAWLINDILSDDNARRLSFGPNSVLRIDRTAAVKTGTTNDFRDNWTVGYTPALVSGVWIGNSDLSPMIDVTGVSGAGPIWHRFMRSVSTGPEQPFTQPDGLVERNICALSGQLPGEVCPYAQLEWFAEGTEPLEQDELVRLVTIDSRTGRLVRNGTRSTYYEEIIALDLPEPAHNWARAGGIPLLYDLEKGVGDEDEGLNLLEKDNAEAFVPTLRLISPLEGSAYRLSPTLPAENQRIAIEAITNIQLESLDIYLNGEPLEGFRQPPFVAYWPIEVGIYEVWAEGVDYSGGLFTTERVRFEVVLPE